MQLLEVSCVIFALGMISMTKAYPAVNCRAGPYDLTPLAGRTATLDWEPNTQNTVQVALCGLLKTGCGTTPDLKCYQRPLCTSSCQTWIDDDSGPTGVSLGVLSRMSYDATNDAVVALYTGGDDTSDGVGRQLIVTITCGLSPLTITSFVQATGAPPSNGGPYTYYVNMTSNFTCGKTKQKCPQSKSCDRCTATVGCGWCFTKQSCVDVGSLKAPNSNCKDWVTSQNQCPFPAGKCAGSRNCTTCTKSTSEYGSCLWCSVSNGSPRCVDGDMGGKCDLGKVTKPNFCPKKK